MVETDEQAALAAIRMVLSEIVAPAATRHSGRLIKTTGDGALIEFPSPVDTYRYLCSRGAKGCE